MSNYLMAIDAGTGSIRSVLFDTKGNQVGYYAYEWAHKEDPAYPGSMDFDWKANWEAAKECIYKSIKNSDIDPSDILAVSSTCMREGIVLYDKDGKEIWACANVDARAVSEVSDLIKSNPLLEKELYFKTGQSFALDAIPRLLWVKNKLPDIYEKIDKISMINDWIIYKLTGVLVSEPSNGSTTGIMNLESRNWEPEILKKLNLKYDIFPPVLEPGKIAGKVSKEAAKNTGLFPGTAVVVGGGDAQLGCIGVGVVKAGGAAIFGGSFWQYEYNTSEAKTDPNCKVRVNCHAVEGIWQYEALAFKPGLVMRWFRDSFCQLEKKEALESNKDVYDIMNEKAKSVPAGSYGMLCTFSDVMNFINWRHASPGFINFDIDPAKFNKYTFYKAILENTAFVTRGNVDLVYEATGHKPEQIVFASGAAKSSLWSQILADVLGIKIIVPKIKEATALGAAIIAGFGIGIYSDISSAALTLSETESIYMPNMENHKIYSDIYEKWRKLYKKELELADSGLTRHLWSAPGL